jgi:hypothetical protein
LQAKKLAANCVVMVTFDPFFEDVAGKNKRSKAKLCEDREPIAE